MLRSLLLLGLLACACSSDSAQWKDEDYEDDGLEVQQPAIAGSASGFKGVGANSSEAGAKAAALKVPVKYGTSWKELVTGGSCPDETPLTPKTSDAAGGVITCEKTSAGGRKLKFPAGMFDIDEQVVVPANTEIVGNANPVDPDDKEKEPDIVDQTYFIATKGITEDKDAAYCGTGGNMGPGDAEALRIGFLLNSNTTVKYISYQGKDKVLEMLLSLSHNFVASAFVPLMWPW
ncbi:unnamed protein product [Prorocentrum cordatum]|uniref:Uncharacterized protein n=1 Tax=Prorocentrum cordatum TaxID=2364126 RepID=A0ABN9P9G2_9DINO|nr:unnamed protein product [Polarella glacialis]